MCVCHFRMQFTRARFTLCAHKAGAPGFYGHQQKKKVLNLMSPNNMENVSYYDVALIHVVGPITSQTKIFVLWLMHVIWCVK